MMVAGSPSRAEEPALPPEVQTRLDARKLGAEALALYARKDWAGALAKFDAAHALIPAPTLAVRAARCLVQLGRWVEASERYVEVTRTPLAETAPFVHKRAKQDAARELAELLPRIPQVIIRVNVPVDHVTADAVEVPPALLGERRPMDPGTHTIVVVRGDERIEKQVTLEEGATEEVDFELDELSEGSPSTAPSPAGEAVDPWQVTRWAALGVAGAGLVAGISHSFVALAQRESLEEQCPGDVCPPEVWGQADFYDTVRVASTIGFIAAAAGVAAGVTAYFAAPSESTTGTPRGWSVVPVVGVGTVGIAGSF